MNRWLLRSLQPIRSPTLQQRRWPKCKNDIENADIAAKHYQKLFNRDDVAPDFKVLNEIEPLPIPTEVKDAITSPPPITTRSKSSNQELPQVLKASQPTCSEPSPLVPNRTSRTCSDKCWKGENNPSEWNIMKLVMLYKGKGKQNDLNNWRGICPTEVAVTLVSSIIANRLLTILDSARYLHNSQQSDAKKTSIPSVPL
jgi:hypothetical protein